MTEDRHAFAGAMTEKRTAGRADDREAARLAGPMTEKRHGYAGPLRTLAGESEGA